MLAHRSPAPYAYEGSELSLFQNARNWKHYWSQKIHPFVRGDVIEVGAGLGTSTRFLCRGQSGSWICLDPDPTHIAEIQRKVGEGELPTFCVPTMGTLQELTPAVLADTIIYIDVLEHIEADEEELRHAVRHLRTGGRIVVLAPAFNWMFSPFDHAIGHHRRYQTTDVPRLTVPMMQFERCFFLDSVGLFASLANRLWLRKTLPSVANVRFWDAYLVPLSRWTDILFSRWFGKSIVMIWTKAEEVTVPTLSPNDGKNNR
jgi:SAM-dependent methyltransferase